MQKIKIFSALAGMAVSAAVCIVAGFGGVWLQEAEAALLPNPPAPMSEIVASPPVPASEVVPSYKEADVEMLARLIYTEARGVSSTTEQAAVVWTVLNRVDSSFRRENTIAEVVTAPCQFDYRPWVPVTEEFKELARDVLERWEAEKQGAEDVGRVLPLEYQYFEGDGKHNYFTAEWQSVEFWDWSLSSPYED